MSYSRSSPNSPLERTRSNQPTGLLDSSSNSSVGGGMSQTQQPAVTTTAAGRSGSPKTQNNTTATPATPSGSSASASARTWQRFSSPQPAAPPQQTQQQHQSHHHLGGAMVPVVASSAQRALSFEREQQQLREQRDHSTSLEMEELRIKLQHERARAVAAEEALIRREGELNRVKEDIDRYQREALKSSTQAASLDAELTGTKLQLSDALSSRDATMKNYRELQSSYRQVESAREEAMRQISTLTTELESNRQAAHERALPLTTMLSQLSNRLQSLDEQQRAQLNKSTELKQMQQSIVDEAMHRFEESHQHQHQQGEHEAKIKDLETNLAETEHIKNLLKQQLDVAHSQISMFETKHANAASELGKATQQVSDRRWLLLQRKWLSQLVREYDSCFRQFPSVLPWFRMPQRKCLRVYVWTVIAALRLVRGGSQQGELNSYSRHFAVSAAKCCPSAVFRKITAEVDQLSGKNNNNGAGAGALCATNVEGGSPLAHLPSNGQRGSGSNMVFHGAAAVPRAPSPVVMRGGNGRTFHFHHAVIEDSSSSQQRPPLAAAGNIVGGAVDNSSMVTIGNQHNTSSSSSVSRGLNSSQPRADSGGVNQSSVRWASSVDGMAVGGGGDSSSMMIMGNNNSSSNLDFSQDDVAAVMSEIHIMDARITRALRMHEGCIH